MTPRAPGASRRRDLHKQDLLLASRLARGQALGAFDELADRADRVAARVAGARAWLSSPLGLVAGSMFGVVALTLAPRRLRGVRLMRWGLLAWRLWRITGPARARWRMRRTVG
jgi:hypothetical protein